VRALQPGSIGIGLYLLDLPVTEAVGQLVSQAVLAEELGFDSATVSEHHGGFAGYLPNPLLAASWILGSTQRIWSGPNPLLLPLRDVAAVAEDLAWLAARFPGRVAAGLAAGYHPADFTLLGREGFDQRGRIFGTQLRELAAILGGTGTGPITGDHAVADPGLRPIPLTAAAGSATGARRAAAAGVGLVFDSLTSAPDLDRLTRIHAEAGGHGPHVLGRRVWVGEPPAGLFERQLDSYRRQGGTGSYLESATAGALVHGEPGQITEQILAAARAARASALALRVSLPGLTAAATSDQLRRLGEQVLPLLRPAFADLQDAQLNG
jgi:alkanesulfonate monooxygenase SsuD/methylene tetrahydromethanopterin reductase-like flavin-dependent oxidoreductase (luciferase family)